jgi:hypothetical protein
LPTTINLIFIKPLIFNQKTAKIIKKSHFLEKNQLKSIKIVIF